MSTLFGQYRLSFLECNNLFINQQYFANTPPMDEKCFQLFRVLMVSKRVNEKTLSKIKFKKELKILSSLTP